MKTKARVIRAEMSQDGDTRERMLCLPLGTKSEKEAWRRAAAIIKRFNSVGVLVLKGRRGQV